MSKEYREKSWLYQRYIKEKLSTYEIARICGRSSVTIREWLNKWGIPLRSRSEALKNKYMNKHCHTWRGGRRKHVRGYVLIWQLDHPNAHSDGYVYEHRLVKEYRN